MASPAPIDRLAEGLGQLHVSQPPLNQPPQSGLVILDNAAPGGPSPSVAPATHAPSPANPPEPAAEDTKQPAFSSSNKRSFPSKVLHVRNLPMYTTEEELSGICADFGEVVRCLVLQTKQQGFVQMDSLEGAQAVLKAFESNPAHLRNKRIFFQYSTRTEITPSKQVQQGQGQGPQLVQGDMGLQQGHSSPSPPLSSSTASSNLNGSKDGPHSEAPPNSILIVTVYNTQVPVTLDNLHQIFSRSGQVLKIVAFFKNNLFKSLVQMGSVEQAAAAISQLDGRDIFQGCCTLRIGYSKLPSLSVKVNGPFSWDFTSGNEFSSQNYYPPQFHQYNANAPPPPHQAQYLEQHRQFFDRKNNAFFQNQHQQQPCVLLVSNLPEDISCDTLFILFGVYGDVLRVKILYNKRDTAMIQLATHTQAYHAHLHLNRLLFHGKELAVSFSKHRQVALPRPNQEEGAEEPTELLTKDYADSDLHRYRNRNSRNSKHIHPPSRVLHISNLPDDATEEELTKMFTPTDPSAEPPVVQFFATHRRMAYVGMPSVTEAVHALCRLHNTKLGGRSIRVSFSPKDFTSLSPSQAPSPSPSMAPVESQPQPQPQQ